MNIVDRMVEYRKTGDEKILITSDYGIDKQNLNVIVINILSWLRLEHERSIWIAQGRKTCLKSLELNMRYLWCAGLRTLVEREKMFYEYFSIKESKFNFSDWVAEDIKIEARKLAYENYNPQKHT